MPSSTMRVDPRNQLAGPTQRTFRLFVLAVIVLGGAVLAAVLATSDLASLLHLESACWVAAGLLLVGEVRPLFIPGARDVNGVVLSTAFVFAMLLRYDLTVALLLQVLAVLISDVRRRKAWWRTAFNVGQYSLSWVATWGVMQLLGHNASALHPVDLTSRDLLDAVAGAAAFFVVNELLVAEAIALRSGTALTQVLGGGILYEVLTTGALLAFGPLVALSMQAGPAYVPLLVPPLAAVYAAGAVGVKSEQQALSDSLTGLANRKQLRDRVSEGSVALVLLDLDLFKHVNDTLGHHVGDQLLVAVARRLVSCVRPHDVVARLGGDEFALVLEGADVGAAERAAGRAREALSEPFSLEGLLVEVSASAGIAVSPDHGHDLDELLKRADVAMYLSKESGEVEVYDADRDPNTPGRLVLLGALRRALENDELRLHYQPKADARTGRLVGCEALIRWQHPDLGLVMPDDFIPLAERSGLITPVTSWLMDTALDQLVSWRDRGWDLTMALNITVKDLCTDGFVERVAACLSRHRLPSRVLQLELTEGSLFADSTRARAALKDLLAMGVELSLDDFGTGWSSLGQLRSLHVSEIKIDRSFVSRMASDPRDLAIVTSVVNLGRGLDVRVVAEGVEDAETWRLLSQLGCDRVQGWALSRALPSDELEPWLAERLDVMSTYRETQG
ncbi:MAG: EAL domain-containing protein [Actinomycetota bacterium]|nr:EAL domain-containing protein [Actinomycetota bacterium]